MILLILLGENHDLALTMSGLPGVLGGNSSTINEEGIIGADGVFSV